MFTDLKKTNHYYRYKPAVTMASGRLTRLTSCRRSRPFRRCAGTVQPGTVVRTPRDSGNRTGRTRRPLDSRGTAASQSR